MEQDVTPVAEVTPPEYTEKKQRPKDQDMWRFAAELVRTALIVSILAYVLRLFVVEPFVVEGSSMAPNFATNDFLIVDKVSYRLHDPQRGDIIVFKYPYDTSINYIKRIIGLPGETVRINDNKVTIINKANPDGFVLSEPYLASNIITALPATASKNEFVVPADSYFMLGDNRPGSSDSREWGFLPKEDIIGPVDLEAFPLNKIQIIHPARY